MNRTISIYGPLVSKSVFGRNSLVVGRYMGLYRDHEVTFFLSQEKIRVIMTYPLQDIRILLVDDEGELTEVVGRYLKLQGALVSTAKNGNDALDAVKTSTFDIIVSDVRMPGTSGIQFLRNLHLAFPKPPKFLFMTGFSDLDEDIAKRAGAIGILQKPFDFEYLLEILLKNCSK